MPPRPNKLSQFWQELKRRRVIHVIIVYATAAFVIIELVGNVYESLQLPDWTPTLVILLLVIAFPFAIIFSWIYDVTLKGIKKTETVVQPGKKKEDTSPTDKTSRFENSIAVLPFQDMSPQKDQEYFCDGIAEEIINALAHVSSLKVIARTSAFAFKNQNIDMREIGQKLNVETLLEGSIRKDSNRIRITAQLIKTDDGSHLWSERFDRDMDDIFAIQDEISMAIVDNLKIKLLNEEKSNIQKRYTKDFELYDLYLKAMYNVGLATSEGFEKATEYIGQALQKDPHFVPGYGVLGGINIIGSFLGNVPPNIGYPKTKELAEKALEIDTNSTHAYRNLALINMYYEWDWNAAEKNLKYSLQLNPNDEWSHHTYSSFLVFMGRFNEAILEAERALELDPVSGYMHAQLGFVYNYTQHFKQAIDHLKQTVKRFPAFYMGHFNLGIAYRCVSKMEEAIEEYRKAVELSGGIPMVVTWLANALYETGRVEESKMLIASLEKRAETEYVPAICLVTHYMFEGDHEKVYKCVEKAIREHDSYLPFNITIPIKEYRIPNEPRYAELMKKVGLMQYFQND